MIYHKFGNTELELSQLGFGCMRFPLTELHNPAAINEQKSTELLYYAIENGINLFDNAWPYHREMSELFIGKVLKPYRKKIYLSTKLPIWLIKEEKDCLIYFEKQLKRLQTEMVDLYLLHSLNKKSWQTVKQFNICEFLDRLKEQGRIRYAGFSFHDRFELFKEIVDAYPWTFCLIHLNYVDINYQAGIQGLKYATQKGLAVMIMEPLRGGKLAQNVPAEIKSIIKQTGRNQTPAGFALRFLYNMPEVCLVLSGMNTIEQIKENIIFAQQEHRNSLQPEELELYKQARAIYQKRTRINCTQCGYCADCPQKIPISFILSLFNDAYMFDAVDNARWMYKVFIKEEQRADQCTACAECESKCPQQLPIVETLKKAHLLLNNQEK